MFWYSILSWIDNIFFTLVRDCFKIILYLADVEIFNESIINDFSKRVYMLLAVIMFFKIAVSTIQYLVDPDKLSDNSSGVGAILKNSAIAIVLLVVVPEVFRFARTAQTEVASYIPPLIMGDSYGTTQGQSNVQRVTKEADNMTSTVMKIFYTPKTNKSNFPHGKEIKIDSFKQQIIDGCDGFSITNLGAYFTTDSCSWNYTIILPVVVAGLMIFVLVSMAVDIAIRAIKFALLEIMAPIPIVSYIDKGGKGAFESWIKEVKDVYLDLFIRIAVVYFIIFIIDKVVNNFNAGEMLKHMNGESVFIKGLVLVFIIIGLLLFGKEAPKYLCDALGIKGTDKISPMFKRAGGLLGTAFGGGRDAIAGVQNKLNKLRSDTNFADKDGKFKKGKRLRAAFEAARSGARSSFASNKAGLRSALSGKGFKETMEASRRASDRAFDLFEARRDAGVSWRDYQKEVVKNKLGIRQSLEAINAEIKAAQESSDKAKAALDYVHSNMGEKFSQVKFGNDYLTRMAEDFKKAGLGDDKTGFVVGVGADGSEIRIKMSDMGQDGEYSINAVMERLKSTIDDSDGSLKKSVVEKRRKEIETELASRRPGKQKEIDDALYAEDAKIDEDVKSGRITKEEGTKRKDAALAEAEKKLNELKAQEEEYRSQELSRAEMKASNISSNAKGILDALQGFADSFVVSTSKRSDDYKRDVGYVDNARFDTVVEEAKSAIINNSASAYGIETQQVGYTKGYVDSTGKDIEGMLGDWMALNKKRGQKAQQDNLEISRKKGPEVAAKEIADKYDKKS